MVDFNGSYVLDRNENLDEYFKEVGKLLLEAAFQT